MKIAIVGVGGVGGYFGARLAAAGEDVAFIARGSHLAAMREEGLRIESANGNLRLHPVRASDKPSEIGPVDVVVISVKLWDTENAAAAAKPLVGRDTAVVSFQNGVDAAERLSAVVGASHVMGGVAHIAAAIAAPGVIKHTGTMARLTVGELAGGQSRRVDAFAAAAKRAGIECVASSDIRRAIWEKFIFLSTFSGLTALLRLPKGPIYADAETKTLFREALAEATAVARACGVALPDDHVDKTLAFGEGLPAEMKSSMLVDLENGRRLEVPWLSGTVARLGREKGVATPVHALIWTALKLHANGGPA